jgi:hypothetical protein
MKTLKKQSDQKCSPISRVTEVNEFTHRHVCTGGYLRMLPTKIVGRL